MKAEQFIKEVEESGKDEADVAEIIQKHLEELGAEIHPTAGTVLFNRKRSSTVGGVVLKNAKGEETKVTLTFEKITVNEPLPAKEFAVPAITR